MSESGPATNHVFFLGAGASSADGFPLTRDLAAAMAWFLVDYSSRRSKKNRLQHFLETVYSVSASDLEAAAEAWEAFKESGRMGQLPPHLPDVGEIITLLDIARDEEFSFGYSSASGGRRHHLEGNEFQRIRDRVQRALCRGFRDLHRARQGGNSLSRRLVRAVSPADTLITTNWDILLDRERHRRFGSNPAAYGLHDAAFSQRSRGAKTDVPNGSRLPLLKLHGSLNWLYCRRCTRLHIDPNRVMEPKGRTCTCGDRQAGVIVTPSFVKQYKNLHIRNVWEAARAALCTSGEWIFIGYSLPDDDVWIRALLLRALSIRRAGGSDVRVSLYTNCITEDLRRRYERLSLKVALYDSGFAGLVEALESVSAGSGRPTHHLDRVDP